MSVRAHERASSMTSRSLDNSIVTPNAARGLRLIASYGARHERRDRHRSFGIRANQPPTRPSRKARARWSFDALPLATDIKQIELVPGPPTQFTLPRVAVAPRAPLTQSAHRLFDSTLAWFRRRVLVPILGAFPFGVASSLMSSAASPTSSPSSPCPSASSAIATSQLTSTKASNVPDQRRRNGGGRRRPDLLPYVNHIPTISRQYPYNVSITCLHYYYNSPTIFLQCYDYMPTIFLQHAHNMPAICRPCPCNIPKIFLKYALDVPTISLQYVCNIPAVSIQYPHPTHTHIPTIFLQYP